VTRIEFTRRAYKELATLPAHIVGKLKAWVAAVELVGLAEVRKRPGLHDEPLKGDRQGQRSVRLSLAYRAIYVESDGQVVITVIEVSKHDY